MKTINYLIVLAVIFSSQTNLYSKEYKGAEYRTKLSYTYGRFEVSLKSAYREGMLSSFFTYYDGGGGIGNWNEIDVEIMGRYFDNAQFNTITPNQTNHVSHKPMLTSPHLDYHTYAFEWTPDYVAWFIDGVEVVRQTGAHIQTLTRAQKIMMNVWIPLYENWAGVFNPEVLPAFAYYDWVSYYAYTPGSGNYGSGNNFSHDWTDNFDSWDTSRWDKATHTWDGNGCDFIQDNAVFHDGKLILCLTNSTNTGYVDVKAPALLWARASTDTVLIMFSEELDETAAENISNYAIPGVTINSAHLQQDLKSVKLFVTGLVIPSTKSVAVLSMKDNEVVPNVMGARATTIIMPQGLSFPIKINCGGSSALDYLVDVGFSKDTDYGFLDGSSTTYPSSLAINGTDEDIIFQSEKFGMVTYKVRVPYGKYNVKVMFAENYFTSSGSRVFDVYLEQNLVIENLDIYAQVGSNAAYIREFSDVQVSDGTVDIQFSEKLNNAVISGIVITPSTTGLFDDRSVQPDEFKVEQNYPNPFNGMTKINYFINSSGNISIQLYDILGEEIFVKDLGYHLPGSYSYLLDSKLLTSNPLTSGVYFYVFKGTNKQEARKFVLLN